MAPAQLLPSIYSLMCSNPPGWEVITVAAAAPDRLSVHPRMMDARAPLEENKRRAC